MMTSPVGLMVIHSLSRVGPIRGGGSGGGGSNNSDDDEFIEGILKMLQGLCLTIFILLAAGLSFAYYQAHKHDGHRGHFETRQAYKHQSKYERDKPKELYSYQKWFCDECPSQ